MPTPDLPQVETAIIALTNAFRQEQGLSHVQPNAALARAAAAFAAYLARTGTFSHTADGRQPGDRASASGYRFCTISENLALNYDTRGFETRQLARDAVEGWKASPGHRKNMVAPYVTEIGVAVAKAPRQEKYLSVQLFGRPLSMRYDYKVTNHSPYPVTYRFGGRETTIDPRYEITHSECVPDRLTFVSAKTGLLSSATLDQTFLPSPGAKYVVEAAAKGATPRVKELKQELSRKK